MLASSMSLPLALVRISPSSKEMAPLATNAVYSPRLKPATIEKESPLSKRTAIVAMLTRNIAGWALDVEVKSLAGPSKQSLLISNPRTSSALLNISLAVSDPK